MNSETAKRVTEIFDFFNKLDEDKWGSTWSDEKWKRHHEQRASLQSWIDENTDKEQEES